MSTDRRGFLKIFGLGAMAAPLASSAIVKAFDSRVMPAPPQLPADIKLKNYLDKIAGKNTNIEGPYAQFRYIVGHDHFGRLCVKNDLEGGWLRFDKEKMLWFPHDDPYYR